MNERPIIFSAPMVRALLEGRKTQTRRIVKPQPVPHEAGWRTRWRGADICWPDADGSQAVDRNPYGSAGDGLWVKETWRPVTATAGEPVAVRYRADGDDHEEGGWRSSLFMPRWASRINLTLVGVRIERLNRISETDALAEGVAADAALLVESAATPWIGPAARAYRKQWEAIHGPGSWEKNPWVWVVEFEPAQRASTPPAL